MKLGIMQPKIKTNQHVHHVKTSYRISSVTVVINLYSPSVANFAVKKKGRGEEA